MNESIIKNYAAFICTNLCFFVARNYSRCALDPCVWVGLTMPREYTHGGFTLGQGMLSNDC